MADRTRAKNLMQMIVEMKTIAVSSLKRKMSSLREDEETHNLQAQLYFQEVERSLQVDQSLMTLGSELLAACQTGSGTCRAYQDYGTGTTYVMLLAAGGHANALDYVLTQGALNTIDYVTKKDGLTALQFATIFQQPRCMAVLLTHGADATLTSSASGRTPLHEAVAKTCVMCVKILLKAGANAGCVNTKNGCSALHTAASASASAAGATLEIATLLLASGAVVDALTPSGRTALWGASALGHLQMAELLVESGADITKADEDGQTAKGIAKKNGHIALARYLKRQTRESRDRDHSEIGDDSIYKVYPALNIIGWFNPVNNRKRVKKVSWL